VIERRELDVANDELQALRLQSAALEAAAEVATQKEAAAAQREARLMSEREASRALGRGHGPLRGA
jgi:hypothetical protein